MSRTAFATTPVARSAAQAPDLLRRLGPWAVGNAPGLLLAGALAGVALTASALMAIPAMPLALALGLLLRMLMAGAVNLGGVAFTAKGILRLGIILIGARIAVSDLAALGWTPWLIVALCLPATVGVGILLASAVGRSRSFGVLGGCAVAVCGASAALAVSAALPQREDGERELAGVIATVTCLSTLAMLTYPLLFPLLGFSTQEVAVILGASIHDVAQVVAAGYTLGEAPGELATVVKLARVAMLPLVVLTVAILLGTMRGGGGQGMSAFPWFVLGFATLVVMNSLGWLAEPLRFALIEASRWCLVMAVAALGLRTSLGEIAGQGRGALVILSGTTIALAVMAAVLCALLV